MDSCSVLQSPRGSEIPPASHVRKASRDLKQSSKFSAAIRVALQHRRHIQKHVRDSSFPTI